MLVPEQAELARGGIRLIHGGVEGGLEDAVLGAQSGLAASVRS